MKINYDNIEFDSELEVNFYKYLKENNANFCYQDKIKRPIDIRLGRRKTYMPDFLVYDDDLKKITIIEMKGYAKWSANEDNNISDFMTNKVETDKDFLIDWLKENGLYKKGYDVWYKRLKFLKSVGFVDYKYKNPNSLLNKRKEKIKTLENENKELKEKVKNYEKYCMYLKKDKLNKKQTLWCIEFESKFL